MTNPPKVYPGYLDAKPWTGPNEYGELPGDICCQRSAGGRCHEHTPSSERMRKAWDRVSDRSKRINGVKPEIFQDFGDCDICGLFDGRAVIKGVCRGKTVGAMKVCRPCCEPR